MNLHQHTDYSNGRLKDAISKIEDLIDYNHEIGNIGTCITEHEYIGSAVKAQEYFAEKKKGGDWKRDKLLLGNEIYLCQNGLCAETEEKTFPHFILIALDSAGHEQIRKLSTIAWKRSFMYKGMMRVPTYYDDLFDVIGSDPGHVIGSTACLGGALPRKIVRTLDTPELYYREVEEQCMTWINVMGDLFGKEKFFLELQPSKLMEQKYVNQRLVDLSQKTQIPYIITTDVHYVKKEDARIHKTFLESQGGERETELFYSSTYCMDEEEIHSYLCSSIGVEAVQKGLDNTMLIYNMAEDYDLKKKLHIPYMPINTEEPSQELFHKYKGQVPLLEYYFHSTEQANRHLIREVMKHMEKDELYRTPRGFEKIEECLYYLKVSSEQMEQCWSKYLLSTADYTNLCWEAGSIVGPGRGSGVGFCLNYMLGIVQVDPLREQTQTYPWRFLNPERASVLDIDQDINPIKKDAILLKFKEQYGFERVSKVSTVLTEKARSAIQSAARGLGYNDDYAQYVSSLIASDRGITRTLSQMYYGNEEIKPDTTFQLEMDNHPDLWNAALKIEGLVKGFGSHAGGVIIVEEPFTETTALMKTNTGDIVTQFDLHDCEKVGLIKIDLLATEFLTKIQTTLELLLKDGLIEWQGDLKTTYEKYLDVYVMERKDPAMWKMLWDRKVCSFFQMEKESGIQAVALAKPQSVDELATLNSVMRLMPQEKHAESPLEKYARFRNDITEWYREMDEHGLKQEEQELLKSILGISYGICEAQEYVMILPQQKILGGFTLAWADKLRKAVAKKAPKDFAILEQEFFMVAKEKKLSTNLTNYVWNVLIRTQKGYGFNKSHTLAYSICGLMCLYLCWKYPVIYWNTACLITDSGSLEETNDNKNSKTGKIAVAIANMQKSDIRVELPLINEAQFAFKPDVQNNRIIYSLKAIVGIGEDIARAILLKRPFHSMDDFFETMIETKIITPAKMVQLIKAGCFVELDNPDTRETMKKYIDRYLVKKIDKLTFAQFEKIREFGLIPHDLLQRARLPKFKLYVTRDEAVYELVTTTESKRKLPVRGYYDRILKLDENSQIFFKEFFSENPIVGISGEYYLISEKKFLKECEEHLTVLSDWFSQPEINMQYHERLLQKAMEHHANGTVSSWEMNALSYYYSEHELAAIHNEAYGIEDFFKMPEKTVPYDYYPRYINGEKKMFPKRKITRIAGTVVDSNSDKYFITLLTITGIVEVKFYKGAYVFYNKKISQIDETTNEKKKLEDPWFKRGTKLLICGYRDNFTFRAHRYSDTIYTHTISKVEAINEDGTLMLRTERIMA